MTPLQARGSGRSPFLCAEFSSLDLGLVTVEPCLTFPSCVCHSLSGVSLNHNSRYPQRPGLPDISFYREKRGPAREGMRVLH